MRISLIVHICGLFVRAFGLTFLAPLGVALIYREFADAQAFSAACVTTSLVGHWMRRAGGHAAEGALEGIRRVEALTVVSGTWLVIASFAAIPYLWVGLNPIDSFFEAMSGLTTTGATVLRDFSLYGRGLFFWRSMTQWLGGMGVIALFVAVLPRLAIGGRELFFAEAPGHDDEKITPQIRRTAAILWKLYTALTVAQVLALWTVGYSLFDAVCHSMTTVAAGGFSPNPLSIAGYQNAAGEWVIILFMFVAGANFALQYRALIRRDFRILTTDEELRAYTGIVLVATVLVAVAIFQTTNSNALIRTSLFQVLSIITTTGFASVDFQTWPDQAKVILLTLMFVGGCAGSAGGGPKVVRHVVLAKSTLAELRRAIHPRAILPVKLGGRVVAVSIVQGVITFFLFYLLTFAICAVIVVSLGADLLTGLSAAATTIGNVGPGLNVVGPMANFADLHPISRVVLTLAMWIGRLEVITVLVIFKPELWRTSEWSSQSRLPA